MKPHDEWNSADNARRAMHMETTDYGQDPTPPRWELRVYGVICAALFLAVLVMVGRVW